MENTETGIEAFTGLILLSAQDRPGLAAELFKTLTPFSVKVIDLAQIVISDRLILTLLISLNPAHQLAIDEDLAKCAADNEIDIATAYSKKVINVQADTVATIRITSSKMHPELLGKVSQAIADSGANIERIMKDSHPEDSYTLRVKTPSLSNLTLAIDGIETQNLGQVKVESI